MIDRIHHILTHPDYLEYLGRNKRHEKKRKFCKHNIAHALDVARIGYILTLKEGLPVDRELLYAAALLHDIGRWKQYEDGTPHNASGAELCAAILAAAGFSDGEIDAIREAVLLHRDEKTRERKDLAGVLFRADKLSRNCLFCKANSECDWAHKNKTVEL
jgi:putative nucleotidyltransferase with HDIG domain